MRAQLDSGDRRGVLTTFFHEVVRIPGHEFELFQLSPAFPACIAAAHTLPRELRVNEAYQFKPERFKTLNVPTLLLLGGDSPSFSKSSYRGGEWSVAEQSNRGVTWSAAYRDGYPTRPLCS